MKIGAPTDPAAEIEDRDSPFSRPLVITLVSLCLIVLAIFVWAIVGRAPQTVKSTGLLIPAGGYTEVGTRVNGIVASVAVDSGQHVLKGDEIARIERADGTSEPVLSPADATVVEIDAFPGRITSDGDPMAFLQPDDAALVVKAFIPAGEAYTIRPGMEALVSPADAPRQAQYGAILGTLTSLSLTPVSDERVKFIVGGNSTLEEFFLGSGPVVEVKVTLKLDDSTPSGYAWSIGQGPDVEINAGTLSKVTLVVRDVSVIGWFKW
jgi:multidrug efflux pump subunit AcrA (membrane-fusion protein)